MILVLCGICFCGPNLEYASSIVSDGRGVPTDIDALSDDELAEIMASFFTSKAATL